MGLTLANIRTGVLDELGIDATDLDAAGSDKLDLLINRSWWEVMDKFDFKERESNTEVPLVVGTYQYNLTTVINAAAAIVFDALREIFIVDNNDKEHLLEEVSRDVFLAGLNIDTTARTLPEMYMREGGDIWISPIPDDTYTLRIFHLTVLPNVPVGGPIVPQSWHEIIQSGAVWRGHQHFRDYNSAGEVRKIQTGLILSEQIVTGKEDKEAKHRGVEVIGGRPEGRRY